jgi:hypothetical protein
LVPLGPPLLAYRSKSKAMLSAVDGAVELVVDRSYKAGDSIVVWYDMLYLRSCTFFSCFGVFFKKKKKLNSVSFAGVDHSLTQNCF